MSSERTAQIAEGFAERLRSARQAAGLTIRGLAEKTGITHQSVVAYEAGRGGGVRIDIVAALADAVGVQVTTKGKDGASGLISSQPSPMLSESRQAGWPSDVAPSTIPAKSPCTQNQETLPLSSPNTQSPVRAAGSLRRST